jgi:hypothetical protein
MKEYKIFELSINGEKEWVSGTTVIQAIRTYLQVTGMDLLVDFDGDEDIVEVPKEKWSELKVRYDDEFEDDEETEPLTITFQEWMDTREQPDYIAGTMW